MLPLSMTEVIPILPGPWEREGAVVPAQSPQDLADWLESLETEGASWDERSSRKTPWGQGYAVIVAVRTPGERAVGDARVGDIPVGALRAAPGDEGAKWADAGPGTIRYFMISGDDVRLLALRATGGIARFAERLGRFLGPPLKPIAQRWKTAWRETFVGVEQVAEILGVEPAAVIRWAQEDEDFPLPVMERSRGPVYVREEIVDWLESKRPESP